MLTNAASVPLHTLWMNSSELIIRAQARTVFQPNIKGERHFNVSQHKQAAANARGKKTAEQQSGLAGRGSWRASVSATDYTLAAKAGSES